MLRVILNLAHTHTHTPAPMCVRLEVSLYPVFLRGGLSLLSKADLTNKQFEFNKLVGRLQL